jgi:hypothetical protein
VADLAGQPEEGPRFGVLRRNLLPTHWNLNYRYTLWKREKVATALNSDALPPCRDAWFFPNHPEHFQWYNPVGDGQAVWKNVLAEAEKSTVAHLSSQKISTYLATSTIRDGSWKGTNTVYLNHWREQVQKLEEFSPSTPMTDDFKLRLIKNAVVAAPHLATIESTQEINEHMGSVTAGALSFNGYIEVLILATQNYDNTVAPTMHSATRRAHWHSTSCNDSPSEGGYNIETPIDTIVANTHDMWITQ